MRGRSAQTERREDWFQRLIAQGLAIGIPKRALLEDYYPDELPAVLRAWGELHGMQAQEETTDVMEFLAMGGERE